MSSASASASSRISTQSWAALLGARYPIVAAPMAGVNHSGLMASTIIDQGAIGSIGAANIKDPEQLRDEIRAVKKRLGHNQSASNVACLHVNLQQYGEFAISTPPNEKMAKDYDPVSVFRSHSQQWLDTAKKYEYEQILSKMLQLNPTSETYKADLESYQSKLNEFNDFAARYGKDAYMKKFYKMVEVVLEERPAMFSTVFGFVEPQLLRAMHRQGIVVGSTTTCFITPEDKAAMEKEEEQRREIKRQKAEEAVDEELLEFTPDLLKEQQKKEADQKKNNSNDNQKVTLLAPPTEAQTHFESGVDFIFLQSTHAGGHQGTVSAPLPIPNSEYAIIQGKSISTFMDPIINDTDPTNFYDPKKSSSEALVDLRRSFARQISRNFEESVKMRTAIRKSAPFPAGHPFSPEFDAKRGKFLSENAFLIGCGGISTGKDVVEVMNNAQIHGASIGSRFLLSKESKLTDLHKFGLKSKAEEEAATPGSVKHVFSRAFGGRWARVIETKSIRDLDERNHVERILPFPLQQGITGKRRAMYGTVSKDIEDEKIKREAAEYCNMYSGSQGLVRAVEDDGKSCGEIMKDICEEFSREYIKSRMESSSKL